MVDRTQVEREARVVAGLLGDSSERPRSSEAAATALRRLIHPSALWRPADLPPERTGDAAVGDALPVWRSPSEMNPADVELLAHALMVEAGSSDRDEFLRVRVEQGADLVELAEVGPVGSMLIAPSLGSRGSLTKALRWRWPLRVGVVDSGASAGWLHDVQNSGHHGVVYDAELVTAGESYEIAIVHVDDLDRLDPDIAATLHDTTCVIAVGAAPSFDLLHRVERAVAPVIAIGIDAAPSMWWRDLFEEMTHDRPIDVAVAVLRRRLDIDAAVAGPAIGMDVTATAHWFAAVAPDHPEMASVVRELPDWDWSSEGGGGANTRAVVDAVRARGGDPRMVVAPTGGAAMGAPSPGVDQSTPPAPSAPATAPSAPSAPSAPPAPVPTPPPSVAAPLGRPSGAGSSPADSSSVPRMQEEEESAAPGDQRDGGDATDVVLDEDADDGGEPGPSAGRRRGRFVQAVIDDDDTERLTFVADRTNRLRCWIGPERGEFSAVASEAVQEPGRDVTLDVSLVLGGRDVVATGTMLLPGGENARSSECELVVPPVRPGMFWGELVFTLDGRMFELVTVTGVVLAEGTDDRALPPLQLDSLVDRREVAAFEGRAASSMSLDVAEIDGNVIVREFGGRSTGAYDLTGTEQLVRRLTRDLYTTETSLVRQQVSTFAGVVDAPEWTEVLRSTATHGWLLHRALSEQGFDDPGRRFEIINRLPDRYVPIEFVYDRGAPADDAVIDPACLEALRRGDDDCGRCHPFAELTDEERDGNPRICPFGFWSLGKIIERHDADEQGRLSGSAASTDEIHSLGRLGSVLTAWSGRLRPEDAEALPRMLGREGRRVMTVDSWERWKAELVNDPGILLALPHHEEENGIGTLEIGSTSKLSLARALDLYVRTPAGEPGPILILLGCETDAAGELGHPSFARAFNAHASIVIGTLSKVLGRHAVPFAQRLVDALVDAQDRGGDVGTVLRDVRREMFADGYLMALGVIALGDGDWQLTGEEVA